MDNRHTRSRSCFSALLLLLAALAWLPSVSWANNNDDFFKAVKLDDERSMKALLAAGVSPNLIQKERGETGLMVAVREEIGRAHV